VFGPPRDRELAVRVLRRAVDLGVNHIDTAQYYGLDVSNELIRDALYPYPDGLAIVSKVGARRDSSGGWVPAQTPAELRVAVEENLRTLRIEQLAALNLRRVDEHQGDRDVADVALEDQLAEMVRLREEGKIAGVGVSTVSAEQVAFAMKIADIVCVQNPFSLVDQHDAGVLDQCAAAGVAYVPYFPLGSAFPNMPKVVEQPTVQSDRRAAGRLSESGRTGLAIGPRGQRAVDPGHLLRRAPRRERRRRGPGPFGRRPCRTQRLGPNATVSGFRCRQAVRTSTVRLAVPKAGRRYCAI
jgi:pyridoxine 4-dehydrogenase